MRDDGFHHIYGDMDCKTIWPEPLDITTEMLREAIAESNRIEDHNGWITFGIFVTVVIGLIIFMLMSCPK